MYEMTAGFAVRMYIVLTRNRHILRTSRSDNYVARAIIKKLIDVARWAINKHATIKSLASFVAALMV